MNDRYQLPSYGKFVFGTAFWMAVGFAIGASGMSGIVATLVLVGFAWQFPPSFEELRTAGLDQVALMFFALSFVVMIFVQNDKWIDLVRRPSKPAPEVAPRPFAPRSQQDTQRLNSIAAGRRRFFPNFTDHYAALYANLKRHDWKITRRNIDLEVGGVRIFPNITDIYGDIVKEWARLGFVDGYVMGEAREKWTLSEAGQAHFAEVGRVHE